MSESTQAAPSELDELRDACRRIWPYIRFFGLCGGDSEAIRAMIDIGRAIGINIGATEIGEAHAGGVRDGRHQMAADLLQRIDDMRLASQIGPRLTGELRDTIAKVAGGG